MAVRSLFPKVGSRRAWHASPAKGSLPSAGESNKDAAARRAEPSDGASRLFGAYDEVARQVRANRATSIRGGGWVAGEQPPGEKREHSRSDSADGFPSEYS